MKKNAIATLLILMLAGAASAQDANSALKPPKGAQVAIVVFEDLQCPDCRRAAPLVAEAGRTYKIPVVRHDYPLPMHNWSFQAAVIARWFDSHSRDLGYQFRDYIFQHQPEITPETLRSYADKYIIGKPRVTGVLLSPEARRAIKLTDADLIPRTQP